MESVSFTQAVRDFEALMDRVIAEQMPVAIDGSNGERVILIPAHAWSAIEAELYDQTVAR